MNNFSDRTSLLESYSYKVPSIYQIETVGGICNLKCPLCPVTKGEAKRTKNFFPVDFLDTMINRNDFKNTLYTELQMYGEPAIHKDISSIIKKLHKAEIKVGASTNLALWNNGLEELDHITVSADDIEYRINRNENNFYNNLKKILDSKCKSVDIQLLEIGNYLEKLNELSGIIKGYENKIVLRTIPDCFGKHIKKTRDEDFCINPHIAVSIHSDGDVVACCFDNNKDIVYGNIFEDSLDKIWNSKKANDFRKEWYNDNLREKCKNCYMRSPALLHQRFIKNWQERGLF